MSPRFRALAAGLCLAVLSFPFAPSAPAAPPSDYGRIEVLRDHWGVPHLFSETDAGAFYALGYVTAEERGFQMTYALRIIQGRLAEILGDRPRPGRRETAVDHDRKMRTFGWTRAAARIAPRLDPRTREWLDAYCRGVNDGFADQKAGGRLNPLFGRLGLEPEPWTPADCLLSWWHLAQFFATDGTRDLMSWRNRQNPQPGQPNPQPRPGWIDDSAAVIGRGDVDEAWLRRVDALADRLASSNTPSAEASPKFSHAWVVGGRASTTGAAVLVSDPQTPVRNPSLWMEFHLGGKTIDVRGIGIPGSPGLLIGFNRHLAWGLTALGADQADLFRLETSAEHPDAYRWNGQWRRLETRTERIRVRDGDDVLLVVRETHLGPIASEFCFRQAGDPEVALKRVPLCETDRDTLSSVFAAMTSTRTSEFARALDGWQFPSANCVYGDRDGHIGYRVIGAIPIRSPLAPDPNGNQAAPGTEEAHDWRGYLPPEALPRIADPASGRLYSANHRPIGTFYRLPLGISTGSMGDTIRSWRLRERLSAKERFTPEEVLDVHFDAVNPARREIVRLGLHLLDHQPGSLSAESRQALEPLRTWLKDGARSDQATPGARLANRIGTFFRFVATPLALEFGGGESGLARFLRTASARIGAHPDALLGEDERRFVDDVLSKAWRETSTAERSAEVRSQGADAGRQAGRGGSEPIRRLGWFDSLDGFGSLDTTHDLAVPGITNFDGQTLHCQSAQSYTQWVPLDQVDAARTICPVGHSERLDSPYRTGTLDLWAKGELHPAPLGRAAVEKITRERRTLSTGAK